MRLTIFLALLCTMLGLSAATLPVAMNTTNGQAKGVTTIGGNLVATNNSGSNYFAGTLNVRSNISTTGRFNGNASGVSNAVDLIPGSMLAITTNGPRTFTLSAVGFIAGIGAGANITITTNSPESLTISSSGGSSSTNYILDLNGNGTNTSFQGTTTVGGRLLATNTIANGGTNYITGMLHIGDSNLAHLGTELLIAYSRATNPPTHVQEVRSSFSVGHTTVNSNLLHSGITVVARVSTNNTANWTNSSYSQLMGVNVTVQPETGSSGSVRRSAGYNASLAGASGSGAWLDEAIGVNLDTANGLLNYWEGVKVTGLNQGTNNTGVYLGISQAGYALPGNWGFANDTTYPSYLGGHLSIGSTNASSLTNNLSVVAGTLTTKAQSFSVTGTLASSASFEEGASITIAGSGSGANQNRALDVTLSAGYTGSQATFAEAAVNSSLGTGSNAWGFLAANYGLTGTSGGVGVGHNLGVLGYGAGSSSLNMGVYGNSTAITGSPTTNIGVSGLALNGSTANLGGFFGLMITAPPTLTSSALMADNGSVAADILTLRDNGSKVGGVADGGIFYGNASAMSNAVTLIAGANTTITTNADNRTFTIASSGGGSVNLIPGSHIAITTNNPSTFTISSFDFIAGISAGANITITTNSPESLTISSSGGGGDTLWWTNTGAASSISNNYNIRASGYYGNALGVSNAVDLIAGSNVTITSNANSRTFTIASSGGGGGGTTYTNTTDLAGVVTDGGIGTNFPACALAVNTAFDGSFLSPTNSGSNRIWTQDASTLTNLNATELRTGSVSDARLSSNVPFLNGTNAFTGTNVFTAGTRTFRHDSSGTLITNTATLTGTEFAGGQRKDYYNGTVTTTVDKTNGNLTVIGAVTAASITANGFDTRTNLFTINNLIYLGTNFTYTGGSATCGITGIGGAIGSDERYSQITIKSTGDIVFTNPVAFYASDGLDSRTFTNGNLTTVVVQVIPGFSTNLIFSWSK